MKSPGFVLPTILFALLLLAGVVAGAWVAAFQSVRNARMAVAGTQARAVASGVAAEAIASWIVADDSLPPGRRLRRAFSRSGFSVVLGVQRTGLNTFALAASASDSVSGASRSVLALARLIPLAPLPGAAVTLQHDPGPALRSRIDSVDRAPAGWACPATTDTVTTLTLQQPLSDSLHYSFGPWSWNTVVAWVASLAVAGDSLPWRFHPSGTDVSGGRFTGALIVDGDLTIRAGAELVGIVIVRGVIRFEGLGGAIIGEVIARAIELAPGTPASAARLGFSSCALHRAGRSRAPVRPVAGAPFSDLTGLGQNP